MCSKRHRFTLAMLCFSGPSLSLTMKVKSPKLSPTNNLCIIIIRERADSSFHLQHLSHSSLSLSSQWCSSERDKQRLIKWLLSQSKRKIKSKSNKKVFVGFRVQKERRVKRRRDRSRGISVISVVSPPCSYPRLT